MHTVQLYLLAVACHTCGGTGKVATKPNCEIKACGTCGGTGSA